MSGGLSGIDVDIVIPIVIWSRENVPTVLTAVRPSANALGFWFIYDDFCAPKGEGCVIALVITN